jgi:pSer/pThr/pTyr-binding forkhead associated (FHA) protein
VETTLGRAGSSDIVLDQDTLTSRHHASLLCEDKNYFIYDKRSMHGVFVNGERILVQARHRLLDGDIIGIGEYILVFHSQTDDDFSGADSVSSAQVGA